MESLHAVRIGGPKVFLDAADGFAALTIAVGACSPGAGFGLVRTTACDVPIPWLPFPMQIQRLTFNPFQTNCYICSSEGEAVVIDPSCMTPDEIDNVDAYIRGENLTVRHLLLTHAHIDHIFGCAHFTETYSMNFQMHREDLPLLSRAEDQAKMFGVAIDPPPATSSFLTEGETIEFGAVQLDVLHTPGHSPGSICFYHAASDAVISGDVLFQGSIGRTDLWRGSLPELMRSIFGKLLPLGDEVRLHPGHGPDSTMGRERTSNPFLTSGFAE